MAHCSPLLPAVALVALVVLLCAGRVAGGGPPVLDCQVYCTGSLLEAVELLRVFNDSKTFVDMPLRAAPQAVLAAWEAVPEGDRSRVSAVAAFVAEHFAPPGEDLETFTPGDYDPTGRVVRTALAQARGGSGRLPDAFLDFAVDLNELWMTLGRKVTAAVFEHPDRFSLLTLREPFIVPGGRFRETYYWDSYWIMRGLVVSGMDETIRGILSNFAQLIETYGFIPNIARKYGVNRSQPPLLADMMDVYLNATDDWAFVRDVGIPALEKEYAWWMDTSTNGSGHAVPVPLPDGGGTAVLNRYHVLATGPRPESYLEDSEMAEGLSKADAQHLFSELAAGAETGWDYSTRWFADYATQSTIRTSDLLPVDLNAILYRVERHMARFLRRAGRSADAETFAAAAAARAAAIQALMWDDAHKQWFDYDVRSGTLLSGDKVYPSNFFPLWAFRKDDGKPDETLVPAETREAIVHTLRTGPLMGAGGVSTSTIESGQQWDAPNAWPPLQHLLLEAQADTIDVACEAYRWVDANRIAFDATGVMHEKLSARTVGGVGGGGEYVPQIGFGWSNGVVLDLMMRYGGAFSRCKRASSSPSDDDGSTGLIVAVVVCSLVGVLAIGAFVVARRRRVKDMRGEHQSLRE